jgi:hypothetical protein
MHIWWYFCIRYHSSLFSKQEPLCLGKTTLFILIRLIFENGIDPINNSGIQRFSHLDIPPNFNSCSVLQFWYPRVGSLLPLSNIEYWIHAFTLYTRLTPTRTSTLICAVTFFAITCAAQVAAFLLYAFVFPRLQGVKGYRLKAQQQGSCTVVDDLAAVGIHTDLKVYFINFPLNGWWCSERKTSQMPDDVRKLRSQWETSRCSMDDVGT